MRYAFLIILVLGFGGLSPETALAHSQLGADIDGEGNLDGFGLSVSLSHDGQRLAAGGNYDSQTGLSNGKVRVFQWSGSSWQQMGSNITVAGSTAFGTVVSLSADGNRVAISDPGPGKVFVFEWTGSAWQQMGSAIERGDQFGEGLSLSADGSRFAAGAPLYTTCPTCLPPGKVGVYAWSGSAWEQLGADITGEEADMSGWSVSLSADGNLLAVSASGTHGSGDPPRAGRFRVLHWSGSSWDQLGADILGEGEGFGRSVSISADAARVASGSLFEGLARVFEWTGSAWQQVGGDLDGTEGGRFGWKVSLSAFGNRLAVGDPLTGSGRVELFDWTGSRWRPSGPAIVGEFSGDFSGGGLALSPDGGRVAIGAQMNPQTGFQSGQVRVYAVEPDTDLALVGLEVIQVVQDWQSSAKLVAGKSTVVRAHIADPAKSASAGSTFRLRAFGGANLDQPLNPAFVINTQGVGNQALELPVAVDKNTRAEKTASAHFKLPAAWITAGPKKFVVEGNSVALQDCEDQAPPDNNDCSVTVEFQAQKPMVLHLIRTEFKQTGGNSYLTLSSDLAAVCSQIERRFPTNTVVCVNEPNPIVFPDATTAPSSKDILDGTTWRKSVTDLCIWPACEDYYVTVTRFASGDAPPAAGEARFPSVYKPWSRSAWAVYANIDPSAAPHELGHSLDLHHTTIQDLNPLDDTKNGTCNEGASISAKYPPADSPFFPYYSVDGPLLGPVGDAQLLVFGYDAATDSVIPHTASALMSYCEGTQWPDIGSYNKLAEDLAAIEVPAGAPPVPNSNEYYVVTGTVDVLTDEAEFDPIAVLVPPQVPVAPPPGEWELLVHYATGPDVAHPLDLGYSPNDPNLAEFSAFVEFDPDINGFTIQRSGVPLAEVTASNNAPAISITAPAPDTQFSGEDLVLEWDASDADNDELTFIVEYSADGGASWANLSVNWPASPFTVFSDLIQPSQNALFRVTALDGFHSTSATLGGTIVVIGPEMIHADGFE